MALDSAVQQSLNKLKQGPVEVQFDPDGMPVSLFARGGVDITFLRGLAEAEADVLGVYDLYTSGDGARFELNLPERSLAVLNCLFPEGTSGSDAGNTYRGFGKTAGQSQRANGHKVRFRPWQSRTSAADQVVLWVVVPAGDARLSQQKTEPHTWTMPFGALPDPEQADGELIGQIYAPARS